MSRMEEISTFKKRQRTLEVDFDWVDVPVWYVIVTWLTLEEWYVLECVSKRLQTIIISLGSVHKQRVMAPRVCDLLFRLLHLRTHEEREQFVTAMIRSNAVWIGDALFLALQDRERYACHPESYDKYTGEYDTSDQIWEITSLQFLVPSSAAPRPSERLCPLAEWIHGVWLRRRRQERGPAASYQHFLYTGTKPPPPFVDDTITWGSMNEEDEKEGDVLQALNWMFTPREGREEQDDNGSSFREIPECIQLTYVDTTRWQEVNAAWIASKRTYTYSSILLSSSKMSRTRRGFTLHSYSWGDAVSLRSSSSSSSSTSSSTSLASTSHFSLSPSFSSTVTTTPSSSEEREREEERIGLLYWVQYVYNVSFLRNALGFYQDATDTIQPELHLFADEAFRRHGCSDTPPAPLCDPSWQRMHRSSLPIRFYKDHPSPSRSDYWNLYC